MEVLYNELEENVFLAANKKRYFQVSWKPPPYQQASGELEFYFLYYGYVLNTQFTNHTAVILRNCTSVNISVTMDATFFVNVAAANEKGVGPKSANAFSYPSLGKSQQQK